MQNMINHQYKNEISNLISRVNDIEKKVTELCIQHNGKKVTELCIQHNGGNMKTIYKYTGTRCPIGVPFEIEMPEVMEIIHAEIKGTPTIWAIVNTEAPTKERTFIVVGTGFELDFFLEKTHLKHLKTEITDDGFVWHLFEIIQG